MIVNMLEAVAYKVSFILMLLLIITSYGPFKYIFQKREYSKKDLEIIGVIFGILAIISSYCNINVYGAISATRNIVVVTGAILFGRRVGIIALIMAFLHRLIIDLHTLSMYIELLQFLVVSLMAIILQPKIKKEKRTLASLAICVGSVILVAIIILLSENDNEAIMEFVKIYTIPMLFSQLGVVLFMQVFQGIQNQRVILDQEKEIEKLNTKIAKAELKALQAQINPHFLFNTLNAISILIKRDPQQAKNMIFKLSHYLRYNLELKNGLIDISKEIEQVKVYLEIEQIRFKDKLEVIYDIDEDINVKVPSLIIQPIVENALIHGILKSNSKGKLIISVKKEDKSTRIMIRNKGIPINESVIQDIKNGNMDEHKIGLCNVNNRLKYQYKKGLNITRLEDGTLVEFVIGGD